MAGRPATQRLRRKATVKKIMAKIPHGHVDCTKMPNQSWSQPFPGVYCCGPVPVKAIKEGDLLSKYDAPFVFAEVNADVKTSRRNKDGSTTEVFSTEVVGQKISTKCVGSDAREDITHLYKYPEGRGVT